MKEPWRIYLGCFVVGMLLINVVHCRVERDAKADPMQPACELVDYDKDIARCRYGADVCYVSNAYDGKQRGISCRIE